MPNLVPIPANAFSAGAVKLDNTPIDRYLLQNTQNKQQAAQMAIDRYFDKQKKELSPTGMDLNTDREGYLNRYNAWSDFSVQNRKAILNPQLDKGAAYAKQQALYNEALTFAQRSKQKVKDSQAAYRMLQNPALEGQITDEMRDMIHKGTLGLDDPNHVDLDMNEVTRKLEPKPWGTADETGLANEVNKVKATPQTPTIEQDENKGTQTVTTTKKFDKDALTGIYSAGATRYHEHPAFKKMIEKMPLDNPGQVNDLNDLFKNHYGRPISNNYDLSAAYALSKNGSVVPDIKVQPIPGYSDIAQNKKKEISAISSANTLGRELTLEEKKNQQKATETPDSEGLLQGIESRSAASPNKYTVTYKGKTYSGTPVEQDPGLLKVFTHKNKAGHDVPADLIIQDPVTKKYAGFWYQRDDKGVPVGNKDNYAINPNYLPKELPREAVKHALDQQNLSKDQSGKALPKAETPKSGGTKPPLSSFIKKK